MLTHGNLAANADTLGQVFPFQTDERLLSILPLCHMFEQTCGFLAPLLFGCSIVYPVSRQPAVLIRTFREFQVTMLLIVPAGLKLLEHPSSARSTPPESAPPSSGSIASRRTCRAS